MSSSCPGIVDATLQKFVDKMLTTVRSFTNTAPPAAPNAWQDRLGKTVANMLAGDVTVTLRIANGTTAFVKIMPNDASSGAQAWEGQVDVTTLASILA